MNEGAYAWINSPLTPALLRLDPMFEPLRKYRRFQKFLPSCSRLQRAKEVTGQRSALGSRTAVLDEDAACLWSRTSLPTGLPSFEKRIEKICRLRARNAPAQLSR